MIRVQGHAVDLPETLCGCPACLRGALVWDGRAWRCDSTHSRVDSAGVTHRCGYGLALGYLFEGVGFEWALLSGKSPATLTLTDAAVLDLHDGALSFPWIDRARIDYLYRTRHLADEEREHLDELEWLMRVTPGRSLVYSEDA